MCLTRGAARVCIWCAAIFMLKLCTITLQIRRICSCLSQHPAISHSQDSDQLALHLHRLQELAHLLMLSAVLQAYFMQSLSLPYMHRCHVGRLGSAGAAERASGKACRHPGCRGP